MFAISRAVPRSALFAVVAALLFFSAGVSFAKDSKPPVTRGKTPAVDPAALEALESSGKVLAKQPVLNFRARLLTDVTLPDGQKILVLGRAEVTFKRPDKLRVKLITDSFEREFYHDGKTFTVVSPQEGYVGEVTLESNSRDALVTLAKEYGIEIPLADLLELGVRKVDSYRIERAFLVDEVDIDGKKAEHWALRGADLDWEIWLAKDSRRPVMISTVNRQDSAHPRFIGEITWGDPKEVKGDFYRPQLPDSFKPIPLEKLRAQGDGAKPSGDKKAGGGQ